MGPSLAELSSLATVVEELTRRVTALAQGYAGARRDDVASELYEVERALTGAGRRLTRLTDTLR
jgi:hypothetical protein